MRFLVVSLRNHTLRGFSTVSTPDNSEALLAAPEICVLATVNPDGSAHAMPMWYIYEEGKIWIMTGPGSQKFKNVRRTGLATVTLDLREPPYYAIMVKGTAETGGNLDPERQFRIVSRYISEERARAYVEKMSTREVGSIVVTPKKIVEFHGNA